MDNVVSTKKMKKQNECNCICRKNAIPFQKQLDPTTVNLALAFYLSVFLKHVAAW